MISTDDFKQIWRKAKQDLILTQATALAYTTLVSLVPILAVGFFIFHAFGGFQILQDKLQPIIEQNLAPAFSDQISQYLNNFVNNNHAKTIGFLGIVGFIFTSVSTLATIEKTFNIIFGTSKNRGWKKKITTYCSLLTVCPLLIGISIVLSSKALTWLRSDTGELARAVVSGFEVFPYALTGILFSALYIFVPNVYVDKRDAVKAGFVTGVVFELTKIIYASYAAHAIAHNKIYGSLVVIPVFLLWLYLVWVIVLFGAELCCYFQYRRFEIPYKFHVEERLDPFIVVDLIEALSDHQTGPKGGLPLPSLVEILKVPMRECLRHLEFLQKEGWVLSADGSFLAGNRFFLTVPADKVEITKIFSQLESHRYVPISSRGREAQHRLNQLWAEWARHSEKAAEKSQKTT